MNDNIPVRKSCDNCVHAEVCALLELLGDKLVGDAPIIVAGFCKYHDYR